MAKRVHLRAPRRSELTTLRAKIRDLSLAARVHRRYRIIDFARRGYRLMDVAERVGCHFSVAYDWVRHFNQSGFSRFEEVPNPRGRPPILRAEQLRELVDVALSSPAERSLPFFGLVSLQAGRVLSATEAAAPVTDEWVRRLLRREGLGRPAHARFEKLQAILTLCVKETHPDATRPLSQKCASTSADRWNGNSWRRRLGATETTATHPCGAPPLAKHGAVSCFL